MIAGALLSGWREGSAMNKGLLTLLLLFTCFARSGCRHLAIRQSATTGTGVKYCQPVTLSAVPESELTESNAPVAVSMRHQVYTMVEEGKVKSKSLAG